MVRAIGENPVVEWLSGHLAAEVCFLTDERSYSYDPGASARMHSHAWITIAADGSFSWSDMHRCDKSTLLDCSTGIEFPKTVTAGSDAMHFTESSKTSTRLELKYKGAASNPWGLFLTPNVDISGTLRVDRQGGFVEFDGMVDEFPAFEAYVEINYGAARKIQTLGPKGLFAMIGPANRAFQGRQYF